MPPEKRHIQDIIYNLHNCFILFSDLLENKIHSKQKSFSVVVMGWSKNIDYKEAQENI